RMPDYLADREREEGERFVGIASDGLSAARTTLAGSTMPFSIMSRWSSRSLPKRSNPCYIAAGNGAEMSRPVIFTISAAWDDEASVWSGHCDDIPAAADAPTLDELLAKISAMALDLLPDNHPGIDPASLFLQITALREAEPAVA
ncbi:MAG TPA: DUF1902 domain-containing protein, partial [Steroidobacteraceae bacterium]|nr:DUF1902 domain-containing protein [Steroidobacteraceae bacterium]